MAGFNPKIATNFLDAAIDPAQWQPSLDQFASDIDAWSSGLLTLRMLDGGSIEIAHCTSNLSQEWIEEYNSRFHRFEHEAISHMMKVDRFDIVTDAEMWPDREAFHLREDVIFARERVGFLYRMAARINEEPAYFETITVQYPNGRAEPSNSDKARLAPYLPIISNAVRLGRVFNLLRARFQAVLTVLDRYRVAVVLVDEERRIVLSNRYADMLFTKGRGVKRSPEGRLVLADAEAQRQLQPLILKAARTANAEGDTLLGHVLNRKGSGLDPILCEVSALRDTHDELGERFKGALVTIFDPLESGMISLQGISRLYGLTNSEEAITRLLLDGHGTKAIADIRSVAIETVRKQVKSVLAKTNSRTRADLMRKVSNANIPVDDA